MGREGAGENSAVWVVLVSVQVTIWQPKQYKWKVSEEFQRKGHNTNTGLVAALLWKVQHTLSEKILNLSRQGFYWSLDNV